MTHLENQQNAPKAFSRRTVIRTAAWSVPVIAAAAAAPSAVASVNNAALQWTDSETGLLSLRLLDGSGLLDAKAIITVPTVLTVQNGLGAISGDTASVVITVDRPDGLNIPTGRARGFGVYSFNSVLSEASERTTVYQSLISEYGFPRTTYSSTTTISVASNGTLDIPVEFGLAGVSTGVTINLLASFLVTATITVGTKSLQATSSISVPVGAGIL